LRQEVKSKALDPESYPRHWMCCRRKSV